MVYGSGSVQCRGVSHRERRDFEIFRNYSDRLGERGCPKGCFAKAACSVYGSPSDWRNESVSTDFDALRQDFSPPKQGTERYG